MRPSRNRLHGSSGQFSHEHQGKINRRYTPTNFQWNRKYYISVYNPDIVFCVKRINQIPHQPTTWTTKITNWWISTCEVTVSDPTVRWKINKSSVRLLSTHTLKTPTVLLIVHNCLEPNKPWMRLIKSTLETSAYICPLFTGLGAWKRDHFTCENFS